jgi:two-component system NtrC family sensor kinase
VEDQNHTELKEIKKYLALLSGSNENHFKLDDLAVDSDYPKLSFQKTKTELNPKNHTYFLNKMKGRHQNIVDALQKKQDVLLQTRLAYLNIQKKIFRDLYKISKTTSNSAPEVSLYINERELEEVFQSLHSISSLPDALLKLERFKHFTGCQVIIHEKGNSFARSYHNVDIEETTNADQFNKIFKTIKKSKGHFFNPQQFPLKSINLIGSILAFTSETKRFNWIVLLSRNDLLVPTIDESNHCHAGFNQVAPLINNLLNKYQHDDKISNIIKVFEAIDYPISIVDLHDRIIFNNASFENSKEIKLNKMLVYKTHFISYTMSLYYHNERSESPTDIYHHYKVTLLGELLNTLGHELSNPLFGLNLSSNLLKGILVENECDDLLSHVSLSSARCQEIISSFSQLYENTEVHKEVELVELIKETVTLTKSETRGIRKIIVNNIKEQKCSILTNPTYLSQVIFNLIINSSQAILSNLDAGKGLIEITCSQETDFYKIEISDNGPGIPEELLASITSTYFTTKKSGNGLGLSICINLLERLGGRLSFSNKIDQPGAVFTVGVPIR